MQLKHFLITFSCTEEIVVSNRNVGHGCSGLRGYKFESWRLFLNEPAVLSLLIRRVIIIKNLRGTAAVWSKALQFRENK